MSSNRNTFGLIHQEIKRSEPIQSGRWVLIPITRALRVDFPARSGGLIWNRAIGVLAREQAQEGEYRFIPVIDVTRRAQVAIWAGVISGLLAAWLVSRRRVE